MLSFPAKLSFHCRQVDGALVAWVDSTKLPDPYETFMKAHGNTHGVDMKGIGDLTDCRYPLPTREVTA